MIEIDEKKCNGCGLCVKACHEGAIGMKNGKAALLRDDFCDGLGDCLPQCPTGAISFIEREAAPYDEKAVMQKKNAAPLSHACPGMQAKTLAPQSAAEDSGRQERKSYLSQWPTQIKLMPPRAPYFADAKLLIAADCTAFAYGSIQEDFMRGRIVMNACPKLDGVDYTEKLCTIFSENSIRDITLLRMEVPCCGGLETAMKRAVSLSGKEIPFRIVTISIDGKILSEK